MYIDKISLSESFRDRYSVVMNGGVISGNPVIRDGVITLTGSEYVRYNGVGVPVQDEPRTISLWVTRGASNSGTAFAYNTYSGQRYILSLSTISGTNYVFSDGINAPNNVSVPTADFPAVGERRLITFTFDGTGYAYYMDGELKKSGTFLVTINTGVISSVTVGERLDVSSKFNGKIEDVKVFNKSLSADEVKDLYLSSVYNYNKHLLSYIPLHDKIGDSAPYTTTDVTGNISSLVIGNGSSSATFPTKLNVQGYSFDGTDYILQSGNFGESGDIELSYVVWLRPSNITSAMCCVNIGDTSVLLGNFSLFFNLVSNGQISVEYGGGKGYRSSANVFSADELMMVTVTKSKGAINTTTKMYKNGIEISSATSSTSTPNVTDKPLIIGGFSTSLNLFNGKIYSVKIFNKSLTQQQVLNEYLTGKKYYGVK